MCPEGSLDLACETILDIAGLLQDSLDRLVVYATNCRHDQHSAQSVVGCQLHPLKKPSMKLLCEELQRITIPFEAEPVAEPDLMETLGYALERLRDGSNSHGATIRPSQSQVFVISSRPSIDLESGSSSLGVPIHLISPNILPPRARMPSGCLILHQSTATGDEEDSLSFGRNLRTAIAIAIDSSRSTCSPMPITDVEVTLHSARNCRVTRTFGDLVRKCLHSGQSSSIVVEVQVSPWTSANQSRTDTRSRKQKASKKETKRLLEPPTDGPVHTLNKAMKMATLHSAIEDLELLLGDIDQELFRLDIQYRHPLIPSNHALLFHTSCTIRRSNSASVWSIGSTESEQQSIARRSCVYNALVSEIACLQPPDKALQTLDAILDTGSIPNASVEHLALVKEELSLRKAHLDSSPRSTPSDFSNRFAGRWDESPNLGRFSFEKRSPKPFQSPSGVPNTRSPSISDSPKTVIHDLERRKEKSPAVRCSTDEGQARQIWRNIRRNSKTLNQLENSQPAKVGDEVKVLKEVAIMNKRSIGADTLRSLAMDSASMTGEDNIVGPWL